MRRRRARSRFAGVTGGAIVALIGVLFLFDGLGLVTIGSLWRWWPMTFIVIGLIHIADTRWLSGLSFVIAGMWMLAMVHGLAPGIGGIWPVIPIIIGVSLMRGAGSTDPRSEDHLAAFWAGNSVRLRGTPPASVTATAVMGGCELDLEDVELPEGGEMTVIVTAFWGGIEIRIPNDWTLVDQVIPILGGVEHKPNPLANGRRLVLRGTAVMGGVEVKSAR